MTSYQVQVSSTNTFTSNIIDFTTDKVFMIIDNLNWNSEYFWRIGYRDNEGVNYWSLNRSFTTGSSTTELLDDDIPIEVIIDYSKLNKISEGITIYGSYLRNFSAAIDKYGNEVWNSGGENTFVYFNRSDDGELLGGVIDDSYEYILSGGSVDMYSHLIFHENDQAIFSNDGFLQHEILKLPNGNYLSLAPDIRLGPIPTSGSNEPFPWESDFEDYGYSVDGVTNEFYWMGEMLVEWDSQTNDTVWTFSSFDMFSQDDFDILGKIWEDAAQDISKPFDWVHFNAIAFDESDSSIYISSRHLSKITKINYETKDIEWNLGYDQQSMFSYIESFYGFNLDTSFVDMTLFDDMDINNSFSFQHGLQILDNGNIVTLDNGTLSSYIFSEINDPRTRALEIQIDSENNQAEIIWEYTLPDTLYGAQSGNVQKLENGNYLISVTAKGGTSWEVTPEKELIWECKFNLRDGDGPLYRVNRFENFFTLISCDNSEIADDCGICGGDNSTCVVSLSNSAIKMNQFNINKTFPNPFNPVLNIQFTISKAQNISVNFYDLNGNEIDELINSFLSVGEHQVFWNADNYPSGIYILKLNGETDSQSQKVVLLK